MDDLVARPKTRISDDEISRRREIVRQAAANNRLAGQFLSPEADAIFEAFITGEIEMSEVFPKIQALHQNG